MADTELPVAVQEEERLLERVLTSLRARTLQQTKRDYDAELLALRDELAEARLEDAPPLIAQMERLQAVAARRQEVPAGALDARSPYFAHMRLSEAGKTRDVCLGRGTYLDPERGVRVVDWRNAPVSRLYYRYGEGDSYEESFGDREVEGQILVRRDVTILDGRLVRVGAAEAVYVRTKTSWRTASLRSTQLAGGQGKAVLPTERGVLGSGQGEEGIGRRDRFLPEIAALLDPKQFEAISRPAAGIVVIQGGAGSGKTTIGLHRIAYLAYQAPRRFTADRIIVVVPSRALASYTSRVLPSLDVPNVPVTTMVAWQHDARVRMFPTLARPATDETPPAAAKLKKHPATLAALNARVDALVAAVDREVRATIDRLGPDDRATVIKAWELLAASALAGRIGGLRKWLLGTLPLADVGAPPRSSPERTQLEHTLARLLRRSRDILTVWSELLTDRPLLTQFARDILVPGVAPLTTGDIEESVRWCTRRCEAVLSALPSATETTKPAAKETSDRDARLGGEEEPNEAATSSRGQLSLDFGGGRRGSRDREDSARDSDRGSGDDTVEERPSRSRNPRSGMDEETRAAYRDDDDDSGEDRLAPDVGIDGRLDEEEELANRLDAEDDAILLRLHQRLRGPLHGKGKAPMLYQHVFVDEVQDAAAIDLAVLVDCTDVVGGERSMTLSGDTAQRLTLDVGLGEFAPALEALGLPHVEVEPLQIGYRSTRQVLQLAREVLGPLAPAIPPVATRDGAPIERHRFHDTGAAAAFLAQTLRDLALREPLASVALIARHPWQADLYWDVLSQSEIPNLRRVRDHDFPFRAGVDLTDVRQVKGLEWDYVILIDVNAGSYPAEDEARHLLHIGATRAAHQLWLVSTGEPSPIVSGWDE